MTASSPTAVFGSDNAADFIGCTIDTSEIGVNEDADGTT
jgi:hypothetical protein